jgi:AmmeMemoRadiSam system protein A
MRPLEPAEGAKLIRLAREAIEWGVQRGAESGFRVAEQDRAAFPAPTACFVSLHTDGGELRGCIGSLEAQRPLGEAVAEAAMGAAFRDPRFPPLKADELPGVDLEISILSEAEPLPAASEAELLAQLTPGEDGVVLRYGEQRATFLPIMWQQFDGAREFIGALKRKAGLASDAWPEGIRFERYTTQRFSEAAYAASGQSDVG